MDKIFLIDGHAQIFRMYYAFMRRPMVNSKGEDTSILFGFTKMLLELINKEHPTHLAVAFDPPVKTFRHEAYSQYKANRSATPELVKAALDPLQEILKAFNIPVVMVNGFEADDVIGSMVTQWEANDRQIYMVTPDKDYGQLITDNIFQYKPAKGGNDTEIIGQEQICAQYGICKPEQIRDILTIWGDASDNVPGVKGIGEIGAKKLIGQYGSIEGIINHINELPGKQRDGFAEFKDQLDMSRFLVTIKTDIDLPLNLNDIKVAAPNHSMVSEVFNKYEFNSLKRLLPSEIIVDDDFPLDTLDAESYVPIVEHTDLEEIVNSASHSKKTAVEVFNNNIVIAVEKNEKLINSIVAKDEFIKIKDIIEAPDIVKTGYDLKETIKTFKKGGIAISGEYRDIALMHYLINPERTHKEDFLLKSYLKIDIGTFGSGNSTESDENLNNLQNVSKKNQSQNIEQDLFSAATDDGETCSDYSKSESKKAGDKCALNLPLSDAVLEDLKSSGQDTLYNTIEMPLIEVLADMELSGFKIDTAQLKKYSISLTEELNTIESRAKEIAGDPSLNLSSPKQIGILLFEKLNIDPNVKKSKKGNYSTDEETLNELKDRHPIIQDILEYRAIKKLLSTYIDNLPMLISPETGKIHTNFNQALTATGRLSSNNPNLQNIPIRSERGKEIRKAFIPSSDNNYIVSADYSQIELRLMAHLSDDKHFIEAFNSGKDVHTATAAKIFKISEEDVTKEQRGRAKTANFGIIYGISAFGLAQRLGINRTEAKTLIEQYFESYPGVKEYMNNMIKKGKENGYVETIYGRKRYLPDINSKNAVVRSFNERNAINAPLQGSAADIIKMAMINVYKRLKKENLNSKLILQVHDELVLDVPLDELEKVTVLVKEEMENVIKLKVPLIAECGYGKNWLEAH